MLNILKNSWAARSFAMILLGLCAGQASAQLPLNTQIRFENVADSTQGFSDLSQFPAINNEGSVAFVATQGAEQKIFKWERRDPKTLASTGNSPFTFSPTTSPSMTQA